MQRSEHRAIQAELFASSRNPKEVMTLAQRTGGHNEPKETARDAREEAKGFVGHGKEFRCSSKSVVLNRRQFCPPRDIWRQFWLSQLLGGGEGGQRGWYHWHL